ncbi:hypothetical protein ARMSODRAFT_955282 [Armillaria solidipes]|uniref:Secreted protein n=1 Tax=Armillaria solidipes TaxID=1076256 RepID=A0A2H3BU96_9AGAR|nr:hypothetical protein ARMSODRAFT_955282 [Armillaria solidipes]
MRCSSTHFLLLMLLCLPQHETILSTSLPTMSVSDIALHGHIHPILALKQFSHVSRCISTFLAKVIFWDSFRARGRCQ